MPREELELKISSIDPAGPAAKTGLVVGDVIVSVDGIGVTANAANAFALMRAPPGTRLVLGLARNATVTLTLAEPR